MPEPPMCKLLAALPCVTHTGKGAVPPLRTLTNKYNSPLRHKYSHFSLISAIGIDNAYLPLSIFYLVTFSSHSPTIINKSLIFSSLTALYSAPVIHTECLLSICSLGLYIFFDSLNHLSLFTGTNLIFTQPLSHLHLSLPFCSQISLNPPHFPPT
jgi:hypothetical protein